MIPLIPRTVREFVLTVTNNVISLAGSAITTAAAVLFASLFLIQTLGREGGPYMGMITFLIVPAIFLFGLLLIPLGTAIQRQRQRRSGAPDPGLPVIDLNRPAARKLALIFLTATMMNIVILAVATYEGLEYMDSTTFCGQACHSVMAPEFATYQDSPHSRVKCVECHIGAGADWFVRSKLSGSWQVVSVAFDLYPRPIPSPVHNLRPARETCEECHWPTKFVGDRLKVITRYREDEANTEAKTVLVVRVGGRQGTDSHGIHWHVDPRLSVRFRSTRDRETIHEVVLSDLDGTTKRWVLPDAPPEGGEESAWRTMDCVDCHNRPTHVYRLPEDALDRAIFDGKIDRSLPFIRREGLAALKTPYPSHDEARRKIAEAVRAFYEKEYPQVLSTSAEAIDRAGEAIGAIWATNVHPRMNIEWGTYPNHIGHEQTPGCFRCHGSDLANEAGEPISGDCETCHGVLAMDEESPEILSQIGR